MKKTNNNVNLLRTFFIFCVLSILSLGFFSQVAYANSSGISTEIIGLGSIGNKKPGDIATLKAHVKNNGNRTLGSSCQVLFWVHGGETNQIVGETGCQGLTSKDSGWYGYDWSIPSDALLGEYKYWAIVQEEGKYISEWSSPSSFNVISPKAEKEAEIISLWKVDDTKLGEKATLWVNVKNTGKENLDPGCKVKFWVSWISSSSTESSSTAKASQMNARVVKSMAIESASGVINDFVGNANCGGLKAEDSKWYSFGWTVPENAKTGKYEYKAIVEEERRYISEWSDRKEFNVIESTPDKHAEVIELWKVEDTKPEQLATLWAKIKNTGSSTLGGTCKVKYWVKGGGGKINGIIGETGCEGLEKGKAKWYSLYWKIPEDALPGNYKYWAIVEDGGKYISPWSKSQSFKVVPLTSEKSAEVINLRSIEAKPGDNVLLGANVKNTGKLDLGPNCNVQFWVSGKEVNDIVGGDPCDDLASGDSKWYNFDWKIPDDAKSGEQYKYWAIVQEKGKYISSWSSRGYIKITLPEKKAEVISLWPVKDAKPGDNVTLWANVKNTGELDFGPSCKVRYWIRSPSKKINDYVGDTSCEELLVGKSQWYSYSWKIPNNAESGTYKYWAIVEDGGKEISKWSKSQTFRVI